MIPPYYSFEHLRGTFLDRAFSGDDEVVVEEKIDGSQFSFGNVGGKTFCRSKGQDVTEHTGGMFAAAVAFVRGLPLPEGVVFRGEVLSKPKHNILAYGRIPAGGVIVFGIDVNDRPVSNYADTALSVGLEVVPCFYRGPASGLTAAMLEDYCKGTSVLGGMIEGVVLKYYHRPQPGGGLRGLLILKHVTDRFREVKGDRKRGPLEDTATAIARKYCSRARWEKAIIHLRERGEINDSRSDIGKLIREVNIDLERECKQEIMEDLYAAYVKRIRTAATAGLPEWYIDRLLEVTDAQ